MVSGIVDVVLDVDVVCFFVTADVNVVVDVVDDVDVVDIVDDDVVDVVEVVEVVDVVDAVVVVVDVVDVVEAFLVASGVVSGFDGNVTIFVSHSHSGGQAGSPQSQLG